MPNSKENQQPWIGESEIQRLEGRLHKIIEFGNSGFFKIYQNSEHVSCLNALKGSLSDLRRLAGRNIDDLYEEYEKNPKGISDPLLQLNSTVNSLKQPLSIVVERINTWKAHVAHKECIEILNVFVAVFNQAVSARKIENKISNNQQLKIKIAEEANKGDLLKEQIVEKTIKNKELEAQSVVRDAKLSAQAQPLRA
ncbi:hypothetical protein, partial [Piscirickettsia salmonis]